MSPKKHRIEIPSEVAALVLFQSDRICCVCHDNGKGVQLHHIDGEPTNSTFENLAVLCFDCHQQTLIGGSFTRKLDAEQVKLYRNDWIRTVEARRSSERQQITPVKIGRALFLRYLQIREEDEQNLFRIAADYPLLGPPDHEGNRESNLAIEAFVKGILKHFRADATSRAVDKQEYQRRGMATTWDDLTIGCTVSLFTSLFLSLKFDIFDYYAGAIHPNSHTATMNLRLAPVERLEIYEIFNPTSNYLEVLSRRCVEDLYRQQPQRWSDPEARAEELKTRGDQSILQGVGPRVRNFEHISFNSDGVVIHFDPYHVDCYAAGKYEVFISRHDLKPILNIGIAELMGWR